MPKLTKKFIESIKPDPDKPIKTWDSDLKGFGLITYPSGRKTYCLQYRNSDRIKKRMKIGIHGQINTEIPRDKARQLLGDISQGKDPGAEKEQDRDKPTVNHLIHDYLDGHAKKEED